MVLTGMRKTIRIILLLIIIISFSCEKQGLNVNCSDCSVSAPTEANLKVRLDISPIAGSLLITVYEGNLEDSVVFNTVTVYASMKEITIPVPVNKKFTVTALYNISDIRYIAVDSATPRMRYEKNQCNNPCYYIYDTDIDLRLKL
jgi:hypothetical protein